ncbi:PilZ domain-containing protein [Clostridium sp. C2-6-12]|uniref:PilZ domain-containing protein n=1 Tax=Clostridium sp. C2-6-12 TaxID=2698832 RepID=UPI001368A5A7|nr:PilZ domain-containing protein [Clostridium sp. C2-6-12]
MKGYSNVNKKELVFKKERRINGRYKYNNKFKIESINMKKANIEVQGIDLSMDGIGFLSEINFKINDMLEIAFQYNKVTIPALIKVQHVNLYDSGFYIGGQFAALQDSYRSILKDLK